MTTNDDDMERYYIDDQERRQYQDFQVGNRRTPLSNNVLMLLGDLLQPQTTGFNHVNLDMAFTFQDRFSLDQTKNNSFNINFHKLYGFKRAEFLERGNLATHLVASRSLEGKSMDMFTHTVTTQKQEYRDKTEKKTGFPALFKRKNSEV